MIPFFPGRSWSHFFILVSAIVFVVSIVLPDIRVTFGLRAATLHSGDIVAFLSQVLAFQFLHGDLLHLLLNSYFLYIAGPEIEGRMSRDRFLAFFITTTLFVASGLYFFEQPHVLTIGISGFCMALLSYLWVDLFTTRHPSANWIGILLGLNIALGLSSGISFIGHAAGALWGIIWWFFRDRSPRA